MPTNKPPPTNLQAALHYASLGWPVFLLHPDTKQPIHSYKYKNIGTRWAASTDPAFIAYQFKLDPKAGIAIAAGLDARDPRGWRKARVPAAGIFFIDIDGPPHTHDGAPLWRDLVSRHGGLPATLRSGSPPYGHYVFRCPPDRKVWSRAPIEVNGVKLYGIDCKGEGGYCAVPPTRGKRWVDWDTPIADAPEWLLEIVCAAAPKRTPTSVQRRPPRTPPPPPNPEIIALMIRDAGAGLSQDPEDNTIENTPLRIQCALYVISPNVGYYVWLYIGAALYKELGDAGFEYWDDWAKPGNSYPGDEAMQTKWQECVKLAHRFNAATIYHHADNSNRRWRDAYKIAHAGELANVISEKV